MAARLLVGFVACAFAVGCLSSCSITNKQSGRTAIGDAPPLYRKLASALGPDYPIHKPALASVVYSSDGVELARIYRQNRTYVTLSQIPTDLQNATIAVEDSRFRSHSGVDARGILRALSKDVRSGRLAEGGSTLTQQLIRNVCLSTRKTLRRKLVESVLAMKLEEHLTKDEILELYFNQVYYGSGAYGVEAASQVYFGKPVSKLSLAEAALVAGLPQRPVAFSPHQNLHAAVARRDTVLKRMEQLGLISATECRRAQQEEPQVVPRITGPTDYKAPHFVAYVMRELRSRYKDSTLREDGLQIYTTLDYHMEVAAENALRNEIRKHRRRCHVSEGCFVCLEPETGAIRAMVGGVEHSSEFNRCVQGRGRQPGSSFKPFVYAAGLEYGLKPSDVILDAQVSYIGNEGMTWSPRNYDDRYHGNVTVETAFVQSINIPAIKIAEQVGIDRVVEIAGAAGIESELEHSLATAIGGVKGIHPLELASAYGTFATGGVHVPPVAIVRIANWRGEILEECSPKGFRVIGREICDGVDQLLRQVVERPDGTGHSVSGIEGARGKTGTTNDDRDAWFVGYVPGKLLAACWVGNDDNSPMQHVYGSSIPAPIWREFMLAAIPRYGRGTGRLARNIEILDRLQPYQPPKQVNPPPDPNNDEAGAQDQAGSDSTTTPN